MEPENANRFLGPGSIEIRIEDGNHTRFNEEDKSFLQNES